MRTALGFGFVLSALTAAPGFAAVSVLVTPPTVSLPANGSQQFSAKVSGSTNQTVRWDVNGVAGGSPSIGVISDTGLYVAPPDAPNLLGVTVEAEPAAAPLSAGAASVSVAAGTQAGAKYYVATNGSNANPGTLTKPWLTIQHAVNQVPAGSQILVQSGVYNELVTITRSGSATAGFISLMAAPSASPIIDGSNLGVPNGMNGLVTISDASWIRVKGFELRNYVSASASLVPVGVYIEGSGSHIEILNNHVHAITTTVTTSSGDALGVAVYGSEAPASIHWLTIDGNTLDHLTTGFSESLSLSGNVERWQVTNNSIHDNDNIGVNIEGFYQTAPNPVYDQARRGLVAGNMVYNITSLHNPAYNGSLGADGLYVNGGTLVTLQDNLVYQTDLGIELASENPGKATSYVWAHDNIVHHSYVTGISIGGADATANGGANYCFIANNTLYLNDTTKSSSGEFQAQFHATNNLFLNNILYANSQGLLVNAFDPAGAPATMDHNLYFMYGDTSGDPWIWLNKPYANLTLFRIGSGQDKNSRTADPQFVGAASGNFAIPSTSPAVALGLIVSLSVNGHVDYAGHPRRFNGTIDAGALQH